ncbi:MAG: hypothetical protein K2M69_05010 [Muribaculaceae bacterium]|nr:hypothetical protein [Muribaculaceae bacterium]
MSSVNVISINPAKSAKSALHPEVFERIAREYSISRDTTKMNISAKRTINLVYGINKKIGKTISINLLVVRVLFAAALIGGSIWMGLSMTAFTASWMMLILGTSLLFGLLSRVTSLVSGVYFSVLAASNPEWLTIASAAVALLFFFAGPGLFSIDQLLRRSSFRYAKHRARAKAIKLAENRLSYRAMRYQSI